MRRAAVLPTPGHSAARVGNTPRGGVVDWSDLDRRFTAFGWPMETKDLPMTIRQAMNNTGNYGCPEAPGQAFAYNDYLTKLEGLTARRAAANSLSPAATALADYMNAQLGALQLQDGGLYQSTSPGRENLGQLCSTRDMGRLALWLMYRGRWGALQLLDASFFDLFLSMDGAGCGWEVPRSAAVVANDYLGIESYGGDVNDSGADIPTRYAGHLWGNGRESNGNRAFPDLPLDVLIISGHGGQEHFLVCRSKKLIVGGFAAGGAFGNPGVPAAASTVLNDIHAPLIDGITGTPNYADAVPGAAWEPTSAGDAGIDPAAITAYRAAVNAGTTGNSGMIAVAGKVVSEWGDTSERYDWSSGGKWMFPVAFGVLAQNGQLKGVS